MCIVREWQAWPGCGREAEWSRKKSVLYQIMGWGVPCKKLVGSGGATEMVYVCIRKISLLFGKIALRNLRRRLKEESSRLWDRFGAHSQSAKRWRSSVSEISSRIQVSLCFCLFAFGKSPTNGNFNESEWIEIH